MLRVFALTLVLLILWGALTRGIYWYRRESALRRLGARAEAVVRETAVLRVTLSGPAPMAGLDPRRAHRTTVVIWLAGEQLVIASNRGVLLNTRPGGTLLAARSPGPGRLVLEGRYAVEGRFRMEARVGQPARWVERLQKIAAETSQFPPLAQPPPGALS